ncbi:MAG TPA: hypothetical protein VFJ05_02695 [Nitrososphaeraceae archaeon]|nr:hypothetical protein [Nitrososphaeraceae archaeon]
MCANGLTKVMDSDLFPELLTELRIAQADEEMSLDKKDYSMDLIVFDSLWSISIIIS